MTREDSFTYIQVGQHLCLVLAQGLYHPPHKVLIGGIEHPHDDISSLISI